MHNPFVKGLVATLAGLVVAMFVVAVVEMAGHTIFPPPEGLDLGKPEDQAQLMALVPLGAKIAVVVAWFLGALAGCAVAAWISRTMRPGWIVAGVMVLLSIYTTQMFPHPGWMIACAVALPVVAKLVADRLLVKRLTP